MSRFRQRATSFAGSRVAVTDAFGILRDAAELCVDPPSRCLAPPTRGRLLLALAEAESALLISGETHLLDLARRFPIQTPRVFLDALDAQP